MAVSRQRVKSSEFNDGGADEFKGYGIEHV
jgi:hypothetical protein